MIAITRHYSPGKMSQGLAAVGGLLSGKEVSGAGGVGWGRVSCFHLDGSSLS